jgi:hypothetical protein
MPPCLRGYTNFGTMSWLLLLVYTVVLFYLIYKLKFFRPESLSRWMTPAFFAAKIVAGIALWWVYTFYYTDRANADIWKYFDDSKVMYEAAYDHPSDFLKMVTGIGANDPRFDTTYYAEMDHWHQKFDNNLLNDAHTIIRVNAVLRFFSLGNYHIHSLLLSFLAFTGLMAIYRALSPGFKRSPKIAAFILFLFPSLVFWSSGVLKEGLVLAGLGGMIYHAFYFFNDKKPKRILYILLFAWLLFLSKFYVLAALAPALLATGWTMRNPSRIALKFLVVLFLFAAAGLSLKFFIPKYDPLKVLAWKQNDFLNLGRGGTYLLNDSVVAFVDPVHPEDLVKTGDSTYRIREGANYMYWYFNPDFSDTVFVTNSHDQSTYTILTSNPRAGSLMETDPLQPAIVSFLKETPKAFFRSLFRPYPWEARNPLFILPALENLLLILFLLLLIQYRKKPDYSSLAGFCLAFSLSLLWLIGITTPVLGALVRYRAVALPFLLLAILSFIDTDKISSRFRRK